MTIENLKRAQQEGVVLGLKDVAGIEERLDIDVLLSKYPDTFNLFLLALKALQEDENFKTNKMSYFQISGIHGLPNRPWDNVRDSLEIPGTDKGSYCPHHTHFFPTWHRPYLAMLEQTIYDKMYDTAQLFPDKDRWLKAVQKFRLPFWDYFRPRAEKRTEFPGVVKPKKGTTAFGYDFSVPLALTYKDLMVITPTSEKPVSMPNPLFTYNFPTADLGGIPDDEWKTLDESDKEWQKKLKPRYIHSSREATARQPDKTRSIESNNIALNASVQKDREHFVQLLINMLTWELYRDYEEFSNSAEPSGRPEEHASGSLEGLHDNFHGKIGGTGGHMSRVPVAAFDPIFWLHHNNIDRIFNIWMALNKSFLDKDEADRKLFPFRKKVGDFWNSTETKSTDAFGYKYVDFPGTDVKNIAQLKEALMKKYGWSLQNELRPNGLSNEPPKDMEPIDVKKFYFFQPVSIAGQPIAMMAQSAQATFQMASEVIAPTLVAIPVETVPSAPLEEPFKGPLGNSDQDLLSKQPANTQMIRQWFVDSKVLLNAYNGSFTVFFFIGNFKENDIEKYRIDPTLAGINHVFVAPKEICTNCAMQADQGTVSSDTLAITPILLDYVKTQEYQLNSLHPDDVVPFLKPNLHWRIVGVNNQPLTDEEVQLKVSVSATITYVHPPSLVPVFGESKTFGDITQ